MDNKSVKNTEGLHMKMFPINAMFEQVSNEHEKRTLQNQVLEDIMDYDRMVGDAIERKTFKQKLIEIGLWLKILRTKK